MKSEGLHVLADAPPSRCQGLWMCLQALSMAEVVSCLPSFGGLHFWAGPADLKADNITVER